MQITKEIQRELEQYIDPVKREYLPNFFKTGKGQYGEGDKFLGIVVPNTRIVAKRHKDVPFEVMAELLQSEWHECRLCALLMLVERFKKCDEKGKKEIFDFYLSQTARINNWDLVVSTYALIKNDDFIDILALSEHFLCTRYDLMQKAVGWMLREMGKRNKDLLVQFLEKHCKVMPRTMLRYAIEKFPEEERKEFMKR